MSDPQDMESGPFASQAPDPSQWADLTSQASATASWPALPQSGDFIWSVQLAVIYPSSTPCWTSWKS